MITADYLQEQIYDSNHIINVLVGTIPTPCHDYVALAISSMLTRMEIILGCKRHKQR